MVDFKSKQVNQFIIHLCKYPSERNLNHFSQKTEQVKFIYIDDFNYTEAARIEFHIITEFEGK